MLKCLEVRDFGILEEVTLEFSPGLTVLTGETGAGKSLVVEALSFLLGERSSVQVVRSGARKAVVQAAFSTRGLPGLQRYFQIEGVRSVGGGEEEDLFLSREVSTSGRSQARLDGMLVPLSKISTLAEFLLDLHGQHEHQSLFRISTHLDLLDAFAGREALDLRGKVQENYARLKEVSHELESLLESSQERLRKIDLLAFEIDEIQQTSPAPGEDEDLRLKKEQRQNLELLAMEISQALSLLQGDSSGPGEAPHFPGGKRAYPASHAMPGSSAGIQDQLHLLLKSLESLIPMAPQAGVWQGKVQEVTYLLQDLDRWLSLFLHELSSDPAELEVILERLDRLARLKKKYGETIEEVLKYREEAEKRLASLQFSDEKIDLLEKEKEALWARLKEESESLSKARNEAGNLLSRRVSGELLQLGMEKGSFHVQMVSSDPASLHDLTSTGKDRVEFLLAPNPGEPPRPLTKIASGGELSRVMLAIKVAVTSSDLPPPAAAPPLAGSPRSSTPLAAALPSAAPPSAGSPRSATPLRPNARDECLSASGRRSCKGSKSSPRPDPEQSDTSGSSTLPAPRGAADPIPTLIFDEIDAGLGGEVAFHVGEKLKKLGEQRQVICVTHLPQIAALADTHYTVIKHHGNGKTRVQVIRLSTDERIRELARMIAGEKVTRASLQYARELLSGQRGLPWK